MNSNNILFLLSILAGFALIRVPLNETFLSSLSPITLVVGVLAVVVFSVVLLVKGVMALFNK